MAYSVPKFNVWFRCISVRNTGLKLQGFVKGQLRAMRPNMFGVWQNVALKSYASLLREILLPAGSDIRSYQFARDRDDGLGTCTEGDLLIPWGVANCQYQVQEVMDCGCGFANEFRIAVVSIGDRMFPPYPYQHNGGYPRVNPALEPPEGYLPLPILPRMGAAVSDYPL